MNTQVAETYQSTEAQPTRHLITVEAYHKMGEAGIFAPDERVELIEGGVIDIAPIGSEHAGTVNKLSNLLAYALQGRAIVAAQNPVVLGDHSEPQPDLAVLRFREDYYTQAHPGPEDILLLIEIADTTARYDREVKVPLYARHGIPEVWLIDLKEKRLEVYSGPERGEYRHVDYYRSGQVSPKCFTEVVVELHELGME